MGCEDARRWLEKLADGEAPNGAEPRLEAHLAECERCRDHRRFLAALRTAGRAPLRLPSESYWESLPGKIMGRVERETPRRSAGGWAAQRWQWVGALAAAVLAAGVGLEILRAPLRRESSGMRERGTTREDRVRAALPAPASEPEQKKENERALALSQPEEAPPSGERANRPLATLGYAEKRVATSRAAADRDEQASKAASEAPPPEPTAMEASDAPRPGLAAPAAPAATPSGMQLGKELKAEDKVASLQQTASSVEGAPGQAAEVRLRSAKTADVVDAREQESFARLLQAYPEPEFEPLAVTSRRESAEIDSVAQSLEEEARHWRDALSQYHESPFALHVRYRLALCSIRLFELRGTDLDRKRALENAAAYLALATPSDSTDKVRRLLERVKTK